MSKEQKLNGKIDGLLYKNREEYVTDVAGEVIDRLLFGEDENYKGRGDISQVIRLHRVINNKLISPSATFKKAWPLFLQRVCGSFLELDNQLNPIGQNTEGAKAQAALRDDDQRPLRLSYYRKQYELIIAELKEDRKKNRTIKTDQEKFLELAEKLGLSMSKVKSLLKDELPEIETLAA